MTYKLQKVGNSKGFVIPKVVLELFEWTDKTEFSITKVPDGILIKPVHKAAGTLNLFSKGTNDGKPLYPTE